MASLVLVGGSAEERLDVRRALSPEPGARILGEAEGAPATVRLLGRTRPDLVLLLMGDRRDLETVAEIMHAAPRPIVVLARPGADPALAHRALSLCALEVVPWLPAAGSPGYEARRSQLAHLLGVLAAVPVVTRTPSRPTPGPQPRLPTPPPALPRQRRPRPSLIVLGASTGGPPVLETILAALPPGFSIPIALVQHLTAGFRQHFAAWMAEACRRSVTIVGAVTPMVPGGIYLADDDRHLALVTPESLGPVEGAPRCFQRPSVDVLFESAAELLGPKVVGVLLTGMGCDGVAGMAALRSRGCLTIAQSPATCAVESMPRGAIERGAAEVEAAPGEIARVLAAACAQR